MSPVGSVPAPLPLLYAAAFALAALGYFVSLPRLRRVDDADTRRGLLAFVATCGVWAATQVGFLVLPAPGLAVANYVLGLVAGPAAVGGWLYFCSAYSGQSYHRNPTYRRLAVAVFLALVAVTVTNPLHHAYFTTTSVATPFPHLAVRTGALHRVTMGLSYALAFVGFFMLLDLFMAVGLDGRPLALLVGLTGLPVAFDLLGATTPHLVDLTYEPLGVAAFAVGVVFVHLRRFETVRLAAERDAPVVALDGDGRIRTRTGPPGNSFRRSKPPGGAVRDDAADGGRAPPERRPGAGDRRQRPHPLPARHGEPVRRRADGARSNRRLHRRDGSGAVPPGTGAAERTARHVRQHGEPRPAEPAQRRPGAARTRLRIVGRRRREPGGGRAGTRLDGGPDRQGARPRPPGTAGRRPGVG